MFVVGSQFDFERRYAQIILVLIDDLLRFAKLAIGREKPIQIIALLFLVFTAAYS